MSHYIEFNDLKPLIPGGWLVEALDDDDDGNEDSFAGVRAAAELAVNGTLSLRYPTPVTNPEDYPFLKHITSLHAASICYARRDYDPAKFPHAEALKKAWAMLTKIGEGELALSNGGTPTPTARPKGNVITGKSKTHSSSGAFTA